MKNIRYASAIEDIPGAFDGDPLSWEQFREFYYARTMPVRTGNQYVSPMEDIYEDCLRGASKNSFLLLGNRGCGKSTELNALTRRLHEAGFPVETVECGQNMDLDNPVYTDLLFLMLEKILLIADRTGCPLEGAARDTLLDFGKVVEQTTTRQEEGGFSAEYGGEGKFNPIPVFLKLFGKIRRELKTNTAVKQTCQEKISVSYSDWKDALDQLADEIAEKQGRPPVILFEDLDKLKQTEVWKVFYQDAPKLAGFHFPVIYTFRSAFAYDRNYPQLGNYFVSRQFPIIQLENRDGTPVKEGYAAIRELVSLRADLRLFDSDALDLLIEKTGGSLRDLFSAIRDSVRLAIRRESGTIQRVDVETYGLAQLRQHLIKQVDSGDYTFLENIRKRNSQQVEDRPKLLRMLELEVVLEHNGWNGVHPLVADYLRELREQGLMGNVEQS